MREMMRTPPTALPLSLEHLEHNSRKATTLGYAAELFSSIARISPTESQ